MATRNRTLVFIQFRNDKKSFRVSLGGREHSASVKLLGKAVKEDDHENDIEMQTNKITTSIPPGWMSIIDDINYDFSKIKQNLEKLSEYHKTHLLPQFEEDPNEEQSIQVLTDYITKLFHDAQGKIQKIGNQKVTPQEEPMKKNVQSQLASQLQQLSVTFRKSQRDYLQRLRGRQTRGRVLPEDEEGGEDEKYDIGFTQEQMSAVAMADDLQSQRHQDIQQILKSMKDLAAIFNDLALLVVEQGTILDRIDYNIEQVSHNVDQGVIELKKANTLQKGYGKKMCMLLLCIGVLVMVVAMIIKGLVPGA